MTQSIGARQLASYSKIVNMKPLTFKVEIRIQTTAQTAHYWLVYLILWNQQVGTHFKPNILAIDPLQKAWSTYKISVYYRSVLQHGGQFYIAFLQQLLAGTCTGLRSRVCRKDLRCKKHTAR